MTGLVAGTSYNFSLKATNSLGSSAPATVTQTFAVAPGAPAAATATSGNGKATIKCTPPASNGGSSITGYAIDTSPATVGRQTGDCSAANGFDITNLTNGTTYSFTVYAINAVPLTSATGTTTNSVVPTNTPGLPSAPTNVTVTNVGLDSNKDGQVTLSWTTPVDQGDSAITGYVITALVQPSGTAAFTANIGVANSGSIGGLTGNNSYTFTVAAQNANHGATTGSASSQTSPATAITARPQPPAFTSAQQGNGVITLNWTAPSNNGGSALTGYALDCGGPAACVQSPASSATSTTVTGLTVGTSYTFNLKAINALGTSTAASITQTFATAPAAPTNVTATPGNASVSVTWTAPSSNGGMPLGSYTVTLTPISPTGSNVVHTLASSATSDSFTSLTNNDVYQVTVTASNTTSPTALTASASSADVMPSTTPGVPSTPGQPSVTSTGTQSATLSWSAPLANAGTITSYRITPSSGSAFDTGSSATSGTITGLTGGLNYTFTVTAKNSVGFGPASSSSSPAVAIVGPPSAPTLNSVTASLSGGTTPQLDVAFTANSNNGGSSVLDYSVFWTDLTAGGSSSLSGQSGSPVHVQGLTPKHSYQFTVEARNQFGFSPASNAVTATFVGLPLAPTVSVSATPSGGNKVSGSLSVSWTAADANGDSNGIQSYKITATPRTTPANSGSGTTGSGTLSTTVTQLTNCVVYDVTVQGVNTLGTGASGTASATPLAPPSVTAGSTTSTAAAASVALTWQAPHWPSTYTNESSSSCPAVTTFTYTTTVTQNGSAFKTDTSGTSTGVTITSIPACPWTSTSTNTICTSGNWKTYAFTVTATSTGGTTTIATFGSVRPLVSYSGDGLHGIWAASWTPGTCTGCHTSTSGNPLVLSNSSGVELTASTVWTNIRSTAGVSDSGASSYILVCPTEPGGGGTTTCPNSFMGHFFNNSTTDGTYTTLSQWITDLRQF